MASIRIKRIVLQLVKVPLKKPFSTHLQEVRERESILLEAINEDGTVGVGECVAFSSPWYTEETVSSAWQVLEKWIVPAILGKELHHPDEADQMLLAIKKNHMAKACMNHALWDLYAKKMKMPLWKMIGGTSPIIEAGIVAAAAKEKEMLRDIDLAVSKGYKRVKIKISSTSNPVLLKQVIQSYPDTLFFADANGAFSKETLHELKAFDTCGFTLIEQPFSEQANTLSALAQKEMCTPFALDESISEYQDVEDMIDKKSGKILVMKQGRVGGLSAALRIHELCQRSNIPIWVGGMIEFGVSKSFNLAFASLPGVKYPGDFSSSNHYWEQDLSTPNIEVKDGKIELSSEPGVGAAWNGDIVQQFEKKRIEFEA